jgi:uncharacterized membrane protein (DUF4010 family)
MLASKAAATEFGNRGIYWASAAGGSVDADAVAVSLASLQDGGFSVDTAWTVLYLAVLMNAALKAGLAAYAGGVAFGWRIAAAFLIMFGLGGAIWWFTK